MPKDEGTLPMEGLVKRCLKCGKEKLLLDYQKDKRGTFGFYSYCRICSNLCSKKIYAKNKEKRLAQNKKYHTENKEKVQARRKKWKEENPGIVMAQIERRAAALVRATPSWADLKQLALVYKNCPANRVCDHVLPLQGVEICGLNIPINIQYLTKEENLKKSNKFIPYTEVFNKKPGGLNES